MTEVDALLAAIRQQKAEIWLENAHLRVRGRVTKAQWKQIATHQHAIKQALAAEAAARVEAQMAPPPLPAAKPGSAETGFPIALSDIEKADAARPEKSAAPPGEADAARDAPVEPSACDVSAVVAAAPAEPKELPRWRWPFVGLVERWEQEKEDAPPALVITHRLGRAHAERILSGAVAADDAEADEREHRGQQVTEAMRASFRHGPPRRDAMRERVRACDVARATPRRTPSAPPRPASSLPPSWRTR